MKHFLITKDFSELIQVEDIFDANDEVQVLFKEENINSVKNFAKSIVGENIFSIDLNNDGKINSDYYLIIAYYIKDDLLTLSASNMIPNLEQMNKLRDFKKILARQRLEL